MPEKRTRERARQARREGKSPSTQAGEFVREEIHHVRGPRKRSAAAKKAARTRQKTRRRRAGRS